MFLIFLFYKLSKYQGYRKKKEINLEMKVVGPLNTSSPVIDNLILWIDYFFDDYTLVVNK